MQRNTFSITIVVAIVAVSLNCGSNETLAPTSVVTPLLTATPPPTLTAPTVESPANGQVVSSLTATLTATPATVDVATLVLKYRFQVFNDNGVLVLDSGLVSAPTWTTTATLTPKTRYTWKVRAEAEGWLGSWSATASFITPEQPTAYTGKIGDWQSCALEGKKFDLVICVWKAVQPVDSVSGMEMVKRVAWLLRGEGAGLLIKTGGDNAILWQGYSFSSSRICYPDGHIFKLIIDAGPGGANLPTLADNDFVDKSLYVPAIDPSKP